MTHKIPCPICNNDTKEDIILLGSNMKVMGDSFSKTPSKLVVCKKCGCVYVELDATQDNFNQYYDSHFAKTISYYDNFGINETKEYFNNIYKIIKPHIRLDSKILDLGSGVGEFSKYLLDLNYKNLMSIDPSSHCIMQAKKLDVNTLKLDSFNAYNVLKEKFDLIIISHVIEHILDFKLALENAKKMLKNDGKIYIEVPDCTKYADVDFPSYFFFTYEHVVHLTLETFKNIEKCYGLKVVSQKAYLKANKYYVIGGLFEINKNKIEPIYQSDAKNSILKYIKFSQNKLIDIIEKLENSQEELILWGIGASTAQLLAETFDNCNVIKLVDANTSRQGLEFKISNKTYIIEDPKNVAKTSATIVILPTMYKDSIIKQIKQMGYKNKIVALKG